MMDIFFVMLMTPLIVVLGLIGGYMIEMFLR